MPYKVLYIDDDLEYLLGKLLGWNKQLTDQGEPPIKFIGLSFQNNDNQAAEAKAKVNGIDDAIKQWDDLTLAQKKSLSQKEPFCQLMDISYIDTDNTIQWSKLTLLEKNSLQKRLLRQFIEKITEIQPDAILLDIDLGTRSVLRGEILLNEIRRYYPYMAIVMATRRPDNVPFGENNYPLADGLSNLMMEDLDQVIRKCSDAIDYRGISLDTANQGETDLRLPGLVRDVIREIANSPLFANAGDRPIIFLQGEFGSGRRLFALWVHTLLQQNLGNKYLPSALTEINCACLRTSFDKDKDRKIYLETIFSPSKGDVLLLTNVDRVPNSIQKAFTEIIEKWKKRTCIIATATDRQRIGLEKLPVGIRKNGTEINCACFRTSFDNDRDRKAYLETIFSSSEGDILLLTNVDRVPDSIENAFTKIIEKWKTRTCIIATATDRQRIELVPEVEHKGWQLPEGAAENSLISLLFSDVTNDFEAQLTNQDIRYKVFDCANADYELSFENEKNRLQERISNPENHSILAVKNILALENMPDDIKEDFRNWINVIQKNTRVMIQRLSSSKKAQEFLPNILPNNYETLENEDISNGCIRNINRAGVFYFGYTTRTDNKDVEVYLEDQFKTEVLVFDCKSVFSPNPSFKEEYLKNKLMAGDPDCQLLLLKNVDSVPDSHLVIFKSAVETCKKEIYIVATVADSNYIALKNLPNNNIGKIKLLSLQDIYNGRSFLDCNEIVELLNKIYPTKNAIMKRLEVKFDTQNIPQVINDFYQKKLKDIQKTEKLSSQEKQFIGTMLNNLIEIENPIIETQPFFGELCNSIIYRLRCFLRQRNLDCDAITLEAEILLILQMHDWSGVIFNKTRSIYDLEEILKAAVREAAADNVEINTRHIQISESAAEAERIIEQEDASQMGGTNSELGFEVLTRVYARRCEDADNPPPFIPKDLIGTLHGDYGVIRRMGILRGLNRIVESVRNVLEM